MNLPKMTDEQIKACEAEATRPRNPGEVWRPHQVRFANAICAARDAQWQAALAEQEPVVVARVAGDDMRRFLQWADVAAFDYPIGTPVYTHPAPTNPAAQERAEPVAPAVGEVPISDLVQSVTADLVQRHCRPLEDEQDNYDRGFEAGRTTDAIKIATRLAGLYKQIENLTRDRDEWKQQHENLLFVRQQDLALLSATPPAPAVVEREMFKPSRVGRTDVTEEQVLQRIRVARTRGDEVGEP